MARPKHEPTEITRKQVEAMALCGVPEDEIARVIGIAGKTLRRHYRDVLDTAMAKANGTVAARLFNATNGRSAPAVSAQKFWLTMRAGWKAPVGYKDSDSIATGKVGKKEQARSDAEGIARDSIFRPSAPPKFVN